MTADINSSPAEVQAAVNLLGGDLRVSFPLYGFDMMRASESDDGWRLDFPADDRDFDRDNGQFGELGPEMPGLRDLRECLLAGGAMTYTNMDQFLRKFEGHKTFGNMPNYVPDTNILYHGFFTATNLISPRDAVVISTVTEEIEGAMNRKYERGHIHEMKSNAQDPFRLIDELANRRMKTSRKAAYIALREKMHLAAGNCVTKRGCAPSTHDSAANDRIIVQTAARNLDDIPGIPYVLTADDAMADLCGAEGVEFHKFDIPYEIEDAVVDDRVLVRTLCTMAYVFGFVKVNSIILMGEFRGKSSNRPEELKMRFLNDDIGAAVDHELALCRELMGLGIAK